MSSKLYATDKERSLLFTMSVSVHELMQQCKGKRYLRESANALFLSVQIGNGTEIKTGMWNVPLSELQFSRVIGEGSFGKVYLGKWQETTVAIKILTSPQGPLPDSSWDLQDVTQLKDCSW